MSVTTQAFTYAINHIESLMKQAVAETKKAISEKGYSEDDYFVISLELAPSEPNRKRYQSFQRHAYYQARTS